MQKMNNLPGTEEMVWYPQLDCSILKRQPCHEHIMTCSMFFGISMPSRECRQPAIPKHRVLFTFDCRKFMNTCRQVNRAVLADSPILWRLFYSNISSSLLPLQTLEQQIGPKAEQMKLWDLPLAHIIVNPGQYKTRRSGWLHLHGGHSFCMEAVHTSNEAGQGIACTLYLKLL